MPYLIAASAQGKIALGCQQGHGQMRLVGHEPVGPSPTQRIEVLGFCVFADSRIAEHDKRARYRLCRYLSRPRSRPNDCAATVMHRSARQLVHSWIFPGGL